MTKVESENIWLLLRMLKPLAKLVKEKLQATIHENLSDVDVKTLYNHNISAGHYQPSSGVQMF